MASGYARQLPQVGKEGCTARVQAEPRRQRWPGTGESLSAQTGAAPGQPGLNIRDPCSQTWEGQSKQRDSIRWVGRPLLWRLSGLRAGISLLKLGRQVVLRPKVASGGKAPPTSAAACLWKVAPVESGHSTSAQVPPVMGIHYTLQSYFLTNTI